MPAFFFGHGNPMNALQANAYTEAWAAIGREIPRPRAIVVVSAHWYLPGTWVTAMRAPRTIHDFGGFPRELYEVVYPAPGSPARARSCWPAITPRWWTTSRWGATRCSRCRRPSTTCPSCT